MQSTTKMLNVMRGGSESPQTKSTEEDHRWLRRPEEDEMGFGGEGGGEKEGASERSGHPGV